MTLHNRRPITALGTRILIECSESWDRMLYRVASNYPTASIKALVARGLLERRRTALRLTEAGMQVAAELRQKAQDAKA